MDLSELGKPEEEEEKKECEDKSNNICIDISLIMGKMGGKPPHDFKKEDEEEEEEGEDGSRFGSMPDCGMDDEETDWKSVAKQLLQAVSMMDTHTDGVNSGTEEPEGALKAIDNETSRILWGKQEEDNPRSSYQNANYSETTSNGLVMTNPAELCNKDAYGKQDKAEAQPKPPSKESQIPASLMNKAEKEDDLFDEKQEEKEDLAEDKAEAAAMKGKGFKPKTKGFKQAAEGIIKQGKERRENQKFDDADDLDDKFDDKEDEVY